MTTLLFIEAKTCYRWVYNNPNALLIFLTEIIEKSIEDDTIIILDVIDYQKPIFNGQLYNDYRLYVKFDTIFLETKRELIKFTYSELKILISYLLNGR